jgi:hypothetical protein
LPPNELRISRRERAAKAGAEIARISRAKPVVLHARVGPNASYCVYAIVGIKLSKIVSRRWIRSASFFIDALEFD